MATTLTTGKVRFSFPDFFEGKVDPASNKRIYSVCIMIPKTDVATVEAIKKAIEEAKEQKPDCVFGKKANGERFEYPNLKCALRDGDTDRPDRPEFEGHYFLNAKTRIRPQVVDKDCVEVIDPDTIYGGCYGRVNITIYAFKADEGKSRGTAASLNCAQFLCDGEKLGGSGVSAAEAFGAPEAPRRQPII